MASYLLSGQGSASSPIFILEYLSTAAHPGAHPSPASVRLFYVQYEPPTLRYPLITDCIKAPVLLNFYRPSEKGDIELKISLIFHSCIQYLFEILKGPGFTFKIPWSFNESENILNFREYTFDFLIVKVTPAHCHVLEI